MWIAIFELAVVLVLGWLLWRLIARRLPFVSARPKEPEDFAGRLAYLRPLPKAGAGAVALAEPDEEDEEQ